MHLVKIAAPKFHFYFRMEEKYRIINVIYANENKVGVPYELKK